MAGPLNFNSAKERFRSSIRQKLAERKQDVPDPYDVAIADYNAAFTAMSDKGISLLLQRQRSTDLIDLVEALINSIANTPKSFDTDIAEIEFHKQQFLQSEDFAQKDLEAARKSATGIGAGLTAGAAVASIAPTAAMWVATTFGTASTGTAISTLSGAAASKAALAWLGGGAVAAGGGGTAAGTALVAMAGPIGWSIAGATLLGSVLLFSRQKSKNRQAKDEELTALKENTASVRALDAQIGALLDQTSSIRERLMQLYVESLECFNADFLSFTDQQQTRLATLVNNTMTSAALLSKHIVQDSDDESRD